jgi:hypothetical protein
VTEAVVGWVRLGWREPFVWRRLIVGLALSVLPAAACLALRAGVLALLAIAVGSFPWPVRVSVSDRGVTLRWLFIRQTLPADELVRASVVKDARRWAWPRHQVLLLERRNKPHVLVFGREAVLMQLAKLTERFGLPN